jgi:branched-chain amino acid transport system ATP-binding protein
VPEGRRVFPSLSVEENLLVGTETGRHGNWTLTSIYEVFPGLAPLAKRSAALLSGGEQQALAIGRALMSAPRLLLLDEVSLGLSPKIVRQLYQALPRVAATGTTLVIVEQNVEQALSISSRVYCLLKGRIALEGRPATLSRSQITSVYFGV